MLCLSTLLHIPIGLIEFIPVILIKSTSRPGLVPPETVIDPKLEGLDTYLNIDREWNTAWMD